MGMFDDIRCDAAFPDDRVEPGSLFQSKSLACCMSLYTITKENRLIYHRRKYELMTLGEGSSSDPRYRLVHQEDIDMQYHGDIRLCGRAKDDARLDYVARFTHGSLEWIRPFD